MRLASIVAVAVMVLGCEHGKGGAMGPFDGPPGGGSSCGGFTGEQCLATEFCDFDRNTCGESDESGTCRPRPDGCPANFDPVCGCDGQTHGNSCSAAAVGVDVSASGGCPVEPGNFACGFRQCSINTTYCQHAGSDIGNEPDGFTCMPLPVCAGSPTCGCLQTAQEPCADSCSGDGATGLTVICFGG